MGKTRARTALLVLLLAALDAGLYLRYGRSAEFLRDCGLVGILTAMSLADLERFEIPGRLLLAGLALWILSAPFLVWGGGGAEAQRISGFGGYARTLGIYAAHHAFAGLLTGGILLGISLVMDRILGKESMGGGDIKLYALLGLYLGYAGAYELVILSCIIGLFFAALLRGRGKGVLRGGDGAGDSPEPNPAEDVPDGAFPFGPSIALAGYLVLVFGDALKNWYISLFLA